MKTWKQYLPDVLVILLFAAISFAYFFPADIEGKILSATTRLQARVSGENCQNTGRKPESRLAG